MFSCGEADPFKVDAGHYHDLLIMVERCSKHTHVDWSDIMGMTSLNPARYIHVDDRKGSIAPGKDGDLMVVDSNLNLASVFCRGKELRERDEMCCK